MSIEDLAEWMREERIDTTRIDSFAQAATPLYCLANNRRFLADLAIEELKQAYSDTEAVYAYTAQVMILYRTTGWQDNFFIRANIWPALTDPIVKATGTGPFFYHRPHDHNFNFLTVGYEGPGYSSNYYEYDADKVDGYPGEHVPGLIYCGTTSLNRGRVMLYRAGVDVHDQLPPDSLSISLNIVENTARTRITDQYAFDLEKAVITQIINIAPSPALFSAALLLDRENTEGIVQDIAENAASGYTRFNAIKALASTANECGEYRETLSRGLDDRHRMVREWTALHLARLGAG
ncbi:transposase [Parvularcula flava]|uniref:Transposase n=1 Tax=Aquisalinus luteolus TaxID=1566827 RepID=A0A8J3A2T9_9PROT|nr:transposase [Aquisalinus luteolus]NHK27628.1 transposase [Aquisalinus luteolus]GGH96014.1 hypothetical protein GCM10011355_13920 [Aquisalinus luteolus]